MKWLFMSSIVRIAEKGPIPVIVFAGGAEIRFEINGHYDFPQK